MEKRTVLVVGGGISGLYAALKCVTHGHKVILLEKSDRLGGHIKTIFKDGIKLESGAGRFNTDHTLLIALLNLYGLTMIANTTQKEFYPILSKPTYKVQVDAWLEKVIQASKKISDGLLYNITFHQLCETVLGYEKSKVLVEAFGYNAEFLLANAKASIQTFERDFTQKYPYFSCVEGLETLVEKMEADLIQKGVQIYKNTQIQSVEEKNNQFHIRTSEKTFKGDRLIFALPKTALMSIPFFNDYAKALMDSVVPVSLHRIYGKYHTAWFKDLSKFTTDLSLRQFIPIDASQGVVMVSYSDLFDADYWKYYADQGPEVLEAALKKQLKTLFPTRRIPKLDWVESYYWKEGVHVWLPGVEPVKIRNELNRLHPNIHIVGECFSFRQGWIEGALETVEGSLNPWLHQKGGKPSYKQWFQSKKTVTLEDLQWVQTKFPEMKWVLLKLPGDAETRVIDVTEWMYQHPGSAQPFLRYMYQDISKPFQNISAHFQDQHLKDHVFKNVERFTISYLQ